MNPPIRAIALGILLYSALAFGAPNEPAQVIGPLPVADDAAKKDAAKAQEPDPFAPRVDDPPTEPESMVGTLFRTFLVLGVIVALIYVTLNYGLRRMMGVRGAMLGKASLVKVLERIPLDPKRTLFVIEAAGEYLLVGGADNNLNLISKLPPEEVSRVMAERKEAASKPSPFLTKLLSRPTTPTPAAGPVAKGNGRTEES